MEIIENAGFSFSCGRTKTHVFEYDAIHKGCYRISIVLAFSCGRAKMIRSLTLRVDEYFLKPQISKYGA